MNGQQLQKFSLSFTKKIEKKTLQPSALPGDGSGGVHTAGGAAAAARTHALLSVDEDSLKVQEEHDEKEELVIPMLQAKRSAVLSRLGRLQREEEEREKQAEQQKQKKEKEAEQQKENEDENEKSLTLEERAERALLEETKQKLDDWEMRDGKKKDLTIPFMNSAAALTTTNTTSTSTTTTTTATATATDNLSASLVDIGKESSVDDYDEIGVESFGAAMLRGMGWKKKEGIGGRKKLVVDIINPEARTLGSSEGGGRKQGEQGKGEEEEEAWEEEEQPVVKGSFVYLHGGRHRGTYGVVEVVDEDHVLVRAAVGQAVLREVEANLRVTSQREYKESARVINKEMYDKYKEAEMKKKKKKTQEKDDEEEESREEERERRRGRDRNRDRESERQREGKEEKVRETNNYEREERERQREREGERYRERQKREEQGGGGSDERRYREKDRERQRNKESEEEEERQRNSQRERQKYNNDEIKQERRDTDRERERDRWRDERKERGRETETTTSVKKRKLKKEEEQLPPKTVPQKTAKGNQQKMGPPWVRENLRVRLINKSYKGGKYHKEKVVVMSVVTAECCECVAEGGRVLEEVDPAWLETVIPKQPPMLVMVVRGHYNGQRGHILQLHKDQEKASVQLSEDETVILKLHYDDICEYVLS